MKIHKLGKKINYDDLAGLDEEEENPESKKKKQKKKRKPKMPARFKKTPRKW